ncbi:MAG: LUD domain-containing protein [Pseudomonadota bacterium]
MSMSARDVILMDVRGALGASKQARRGPRDITEEANALLADIDKTRPTLPDNDPVESFAQRVVGPKVNATLDRIEQLDDVPSAVVRYVEAHSLERSTSVAPHQDLADLDWMGSNLNVVPDASDGTFVALAGWAIAETGSVVLHSANDTPILPNFLAATQIVIVYQSSIVAHLEDYIAAAQAAGDPAPRNACLVTGPSGTSDIEGAFVRGAHGPRNVHIIIVSSL